MSAQRRSMTAVLETDELNEKERAFIRGESVKGAVQEAQVVEAPTTASTVESSEPVATARPTARGHLRVIPAMVSLSTRIPADLHERLMRVSFERKLEHREPCTHQDIITEAISAWLKKAGNS
jgi:hypothetical protein